MLIFFENMSRNFQVSLISDKNKGTLLEDQYTFMIVYLTQIFLERIMFQSEVVGKIKAHILCSITFVDSHAICEITQKNTVQRYALQMIMWCMFIAFWICKATNRICNSCSEYVIFIALPLQQLLQECTLVLRLCVHCLSCFECVHVLSLFICPSVCIQQLQNPGIDVYEVLHWGVL